MFLFPCIWKELTSCNFEREKKPAMNLIVAEEQNKQEWAVEIGKILHI